MSHSERDVPSSSVHAHSPQDYSVVLGGPLYQLWLRTRIVKPPLDLLARRMIVIALIAWLPPFLLAVLSGRAWGGAKVPFLLDVATHARLLIALPLLIYAEWLVHYRIRPVIAEFLERDLVLPGQRQRFDEIVAGSTRLRNSVLAEVLLIVSILTLGQFVWRSQASLQTDSWYRQSAESAAGLTLPGAYFVFVSIPLFHFILYRWYFRLFIWYRFLWKVSRLDLQLIPTHPDRAGGLGFLQGSAHALVPLVLAHSVVVSGVLANRIFHQGGTLPMFKLEIFWTVVILLLMAFAPMLVFAAKLMACRRLGMRMYGRLAARYARAFDHKWVRGEAPPGESFLGSADIQSLADMGSSFDVIREIMPVPFGRKAVVNLAIIILIPMLPLVLTMIRFSELVDRLLQTAI